MPIVSEAIDIEMMRRSLYPIDFSRRYEDGELILSRCPFCLYPVRHDFEVMYSVCHCRAVTVILKERVMQTMEIAPDYIFLRIPNGVMVSQGESIVSMRRILKVPFQFDVKEVLSRATKIAILM